MKTVTIYSFITLVALSMLIAVSPATAQDMRIGFVDPQVILQRMPEMRAVEQRFQNFVQRKQEEIGSKEQEFQTELERYQQRLGVISEEAQQAEEERLGNLQAELFQLQNEAQQEIQQEQANLMGPLLQQIQGSIDNVASARGLDYVLNTMTTDGTVIILYVSDAVRAEYDITDEVMRDMGI